MMSGNRRPKVGIGCIVCNGNRVLIGKRKGKLGSGEWALPGGHLEFAESPEECAAREILEETGLAVQNLRFERLENCIHQDDRGQPMAHYVTIFMRGEVDQDAEPQNLEPDKCEGWHWEDWASIPNPQFQGLRQLISAGYHPFAGPL